jgi:hypothetical protein
MSCSSVRASPRAFVISWRTVTNTSGPLRPCLMETSLMRDKRRGLVVDPQSVVEPQAPARPHASRQRNRRQEPAAAGVPVGSDFAGGRHRIEVDPVPKRRKLAARQGFAFAAVERGRQRRCRCGPDQVRPSFLAADPVAQAFEFHAKPLCLPTSRYCARAERCRQFVNREPRLRPPLTAAMGRPGCRGRSGIIHTPCPCTSIWSICG